MPSPAELQKWREHGLCFHCDERYTFNHECKKLFWIEIEGEDKQPTITKEVLAEGELGDDNPKKILNALMGVMTPQTMGVIATIGKFPLTTLIDTGSTLQLLT